MLGGTCDCEIGGPHNSCFLSLAAIGVKGNIVHPPKDEHSVDDLFFHVGSYTFSISFLYVPISIEKEIEDMLEL